MAARLHNLGLNRVQDLLFHLPLRYEDRTRLIPLNALSPGLSALAAGRVEHVELRRGYRRSALIQLTDGHGRLSVRLFHFSQAQLRRLQPGTWLRLFGEVRPGPEMVHPEYRVIEAGDAGRAEKSRLTPIYPTTSGLGQGRLRKAIAQALRLLDSPNVLPELLPEAIRRGHSLMSLARALETVHHPPPS